MIRAWQNTGTDLPELAALLSAYMAETYDDTWRGTLERLAFDQREGRVSILVAERNDRLIGLLAWSDADDLHH
mgnify:CR=1 FL=1